MFQEKTFRDKVVTGMFTLPATAALATLVWVLPDAGDATLWGGLAVTGLVSYLLVELNNRNALLRIRSRMVSSVYLALMSVCVFLHPLSVSMLPAVCLAASYFPLFAAYQQPRAAGEVFHVFLLLSAGSLCWPPLLLLSVACYAGLAFPLRALTGRTFMAGLFGLVTPYWLATGLLMWQGDLPQAWENFLSAFRFTRPDYTLLTGPQAASLILTGVLALMSVAHFLRTAFGDKIRVRMYFYAIILQEVLLLAGTALLPSRFDLLFPLLVTNTAPLAAHYFALARGRWMNIWFIVWLLLLAGLFLFNTLCAWKVS